MLKNTPTTNYNTFSSDDQYQTMTDEDIETGLHTPDEYKEFQRKHSTSMSLSTTIPPSQQIITQQKKNRPLDDFLAHISDMGFDRNLAETTFKKYLSEYDNDATLFTYEEVMNEMFREKDSDEEENLVNNNKKIEINNEIKEIEYENNSGKIECSICTLFYNENDISKATCSHNYCRNCLTHYYNDKISNGFIKFCCMDEKCDREITENELKQFVDENIIAKWKKFQKNFKLAQDKTVRWCVKPGCDTPLFRKKDYDKVNNNKKKLICPTCGTTVCYNCAGLYHNSKKCDTVLDQKLSNWIKKSNIDVQKCPKCDANIQKLVGCNHMKCSYCKYEFCWLCRKKFTKGHYDPSNILFGCPGAENGDTRPNKCFACCQLISSCLLTCCLPCRICCWRCKEQGFPWCLCWCCCGEY